MINQHEHQHQLAVNRDIRLRYCRGIRPYLALQKGLHHDRRRLSRRLDIGTAVYIIVIAILIALAATTRATEPVAVMAGTNGVVATPAALEARIAAAPNATLLVYQGTNIVGTLALDPERFTWDGTNLTLSSDTMETITGAVQQTDTVYTGTVAKASGALPRDGTLPMTGNLDVGANTLKIGDAEISFDPDPMNAWPLNIDHDIDVPGILTYWVDLTGGIYFEAGSNIDGEEDIQFNQSIIITGDATANNFRGTLHGSNIVSESITASAIDPTLDAEYRAGSDALTAFAARTNTAIAATATNLTLAATAWQHVTVTNAVTFAWTNTVADSYTISAAVGTNAITWPANWTWLPDAYPPEGSNIVVSVWPAPAGGTNWYAVGGGK